MTVVERIDKNSNLPGFRRDTITLGWEERRQGHGRRKSDGGIDFAISLPGGTVLKEGDCFVLPSEKVVVVIREAPEPVYVIHPKTPQEWAYYAYHAGNRHQAVMIGETELIFLQNPAVKSLLDQLHVHYEPATRPFTAALSTVHAHEH
jgi:urease accessory protein UreE